MLSRKERKKRGLTGVQVLTNPKTGEKFLVSKIVVQSVIGHFNWKKEKPYSDTKENKGID